jgi:hypothetical protein
VSERRIGGVLRDIVDFSLQVTDPVMRPTTSVQPGFATCAQDMINAAIFITYSLCNFYNEGSA